MRQLQVGIGLPNTVPGASRARMLDWSVRAEQLGASSIATVDRLSYPSWDPMITLAAAAAVTTTPRLVSSVLVSPLRPNTAVLAQETASLDRLSESRLVLGLGVSRRPDDYDQSGLDFHQRGKALDKQLDELNAFWAAARVPGGIRRSGSLRRPESARAHRRPGARDLAAGSQVGQRLDRGRRARGLGQRRHFRRARAGDLA